VLPEILPPEEALPEVLRVPAHHDLPRLREAHEPGRDVGRIADGRVVHAEVPTDCADDDDSGVQPRPQAEVDTVRAFHVGLQRLKTVADRKRRRERAVGVVLVRDRGAEERHDAVAEELVDRALVTVDRLEHDLERPVDDRVDVFGIEPLGHRREAGDVGEHDRHLLALAFDGAARGEDFVGEMLRRVGGGRGEALRWRSARCRVNA
jgi:hypothetical protein